MTRITTLGIAAIAMLHLSFLVLEMFLWAKPKGLASFKQALAQAQASATLAANQDLYTGFLAAGLVEPAAWRGRVRLAA